MKQIFFLLAFTFINLQVSNANISTNENHTFPGRISKINKIAKLIRFKIKFENAKFLSRYERVEIWNPSFPNKKCLGFIEGRSSEYLLVKVPKFAQCKSTVYFATGSYMHMYSPNLVSNLDTVKDLLNILHKKRMALDARMSRYQRSLNSYIEKIDVMNKRYEVLRQKLELEWQKEIAGLEEDKSKSYTLLKETEAKLHDIEYKVQRYRVKDQNMTEDRWSLDPKLYYKK